MNYGPLIFLGAFLAFASAWLGLVFFPVQQFKDLQPQVVAGTTQTHPRPYSGVELRGRRVYQSEGCVYCHSQQVRGGDYVADELRGWGRRSVPQDYIYDNPLLLGTMRTGPDLMNIGARQPSADWHYKHLYNPQKVAPGSVMPPFRFLFQMRRIDGQPSPEALRFDDTWTEADGKPKAGYELVPTEQAQALVAYLKSLDHTYDVE
jgi:cytochrome c oxidase cbb3-type subunit 2